MYKKALGPSFIIIASSFFRGLYYIQMVMEKNARGWLRFVFTRAVEPEPRSRSYFGRSEPEKYT